jgi:hypothetical protein
LKKNYQSIMKKSTRRSFLQSSGLTAASAIGFPAIVRGQNLNSKIRVACIGVGGKGDSDTKNAAKEGGEIAALCDVDSQYAGEDGEEFPEGGEVPGFPGDVRQDGRPDRCRDCFDS